MNMPKPNSIWYPRGKENEHHHVKTVTKHDVYGLCGGKMFRINLRDWGVMKELKI